MGKAQSSVVHPLLLNTNKRVLRLRCQHSGTSRAHRKRSTLKLSSLQSNGDHAFPLSFGQHFKCYFRSCCTVPIAAKRAATCVREALTLSCSYGAIWQLECLRRRSKEDAGAQRCGSERIQQGI